MSLRFRTIAGLLGIVVFQITRAQAIPPGPAEDLVFFNQDHLSAVKAAIADENPCFTKRYPRLLAESDALLAKEPDPVVNKTVVPPSGSLHDYLSYAPYR